MTKYILALDQGTTSSRAILFDHAGRPHASAQREFRQIFPQPGWVEHDAGEIWASQEGVLQQVLRDSGVAASDVAAIGVTNQRETTVLWDRATGVPVANAIVWQDRRNAAFCEQLVEQGKADVIQRKTGLVLDAYFPPPSSNGCSTTWTARARAERGELAFGTVDSWLIYKMSGAHITDTSNAARTMLFNIHTLRGTRICWRCWIFPPLLPDVVPSSGVAAHACGLAGRVRAHRRHRRRPAGGHVRPGLFETGHGEEYLWHGLLHADERGQASFAIEQPAADDRGLELGVDADQTDYLLEGSAFIAGAAVQWMRDGIGIIRDSSEVEARTSVPDSGGLMVPAFAPGRAVLGPVCAGHPDRHHAGHGQGAHRARGAGRRGLPERGRAVRHAG
jgi:glycerol kinase